MWRQVFALLVILALFLPVVAAGQTSTVLVVTGSSMPEPLYSRWNDEYHKQQPSVLVRYLPEGSGAGASRVLTGSGDFAGGDAPIPEKDLKNSTNKVVELPTVLIGIVVVYNLPAARGELHLSGPALASIYMGKITAWDDPVLVKLNPDMKLPAIPIRVWHRTPGKGSSYILTDYLSKVSPEFLKIVGRSESPSWPVGDSAGRSEDMVERVQATAGAIGYTELNWAEKSSLRMANIKNADGEFARPSTRSISAAAVALMSKADADFRISLTNAPGKDTYPISSFTWFYVPAVSKDSERGRAISEYLRWVYTSGEKIAQEQGYPPLPEQLLAKVAARAATIR
ncbi:MAG TPA: phosphate ABC transporter substrate-binding protein PstS [Candidatus Methylomirabilis sp.]|nr:phosphate ABC transporter substrate-binding protein PstS [Candidatus Methylomirabilis sp.]